MAVKNNSQSMRLSWQEIRANAAAFSREYAGATYERGETQTFYNDFFAVFGVKRSRVASFEEPVKKLGDKQGFIDLFWRGVLLVEQKSAGRDLVKAKTQALEYFPGLKDYELPRYILLSDFQTFELYDLEEGDELKFALSELHKHVEAFGFILGVQKRTFKDQDPVNIDASELMGRLHDVLKDSGYVGHDLERFLVRLLFCLFADDTGIFEPRDIFLELIAERTREDGVDVGERLAALFEVLNTPIEKRQKKLDEDLARFPYVNGELFAERLPIPSFDREMRTLLLEACNFSWDAVSPAIFGSLFQSVMNKNERRAQGAHYTTEKNILKAIEPLFLDDLHTELGKIKSRRDNGRTAALRGFQDKLATLKFFDPACGCGNFLIISYREIRTLEIEVLRELNTTGQMVLDISTLSKVNVNQFYGIEIDEFPARIAEVALWMMDHIMNNRISVEFGSFYARIPLKVSPHILNADALEADWTAHIDPRECTYVLGNPPFVGAKYQSDVQREQVRRIAQLGGSGGTLDFVCAWFLKAADYVRSTGIQIAFVATNSITQGEQVAQLWPLLLDRHDLEISFAHQTFAWGSDARGQAHVHVVIVGLTPRSRATAERRLFSYRTLVSEPSESIHQVISPYLFDASMLKNPHLVVHEESRPLTDVPQLVIGSKPIDGGHYIFGDAERIELLKREPGAGKFLHPYIGSQEFLNGGGRWILALDGTGPSELKSMPLVVERIAAVRKFRSESKSKQTRDLANSPTRYHVTVIPDRSFMVVPEVSSERREYVPIAWLEPPIIPSNLVRVMLGADLWHFAILTSKMHMAWLRHIGGRLKSDYRYSIGIVYNPFPWPVGLSDKQRSEIRDAAQDVLNARTAFPGSTLSDLYDPDLMPSALRKAHARLDGLVDAAYRKTPFSSERERVEHLFTRYEGLVAPLMQLEKPKRKVSKKSVH